MHIHIAHTHACSVQKLFFLMQKLLEISELISKLILNLIWNYLIISNSAETQATNFSPSQDFAESLCFSCIQYSSWHRSQLRRCLQLRCLVPTLMENCLPHATERKKKIIETILVFSLLSHCGGSHRLMSQAEYPPHCLLEHGYHTVCVNKTQNFISAANQCISCSALNRICWGKYNYLSCVMCT